MLQRPKRNSVGKTGHKCDASAPVLSRKMYSPHSPVTLSSGHMNRKENVRPSGLIFQQNRMGVNKYASSMSLCVGENAYTYRAGRRNTTDASASKDAVEIGSHAEKRRQKKSDEEVRRLRQSSTSSRTLAYDDVQIRGLKKKMRDVINRPERNVFMGLL